MSSKVVALGIILVFITSCDFFNQTDIDEKHTIYLYNETRASCPLLIYMDLSYQSDLPYMCGNCIIDNVTEGSHLLEAYEDLDGEPGEMIASVLITMDRYEDWWWRITSCP